MPGSLVEENLAVPCIIDDGREDLLALVEERDSPMLETVSLPRLSPMHEFHLVQFSTGTFRLFLLLIHPPAKK